MNGKNLEKLVTEALAIEAETALEAGTLGYLARAMVQATMPHRRSDDGSHERVNGSYRCRGAPDPRTREIVLGASMSAFMRELGMVPTGGRWGTVTRLKDQSKRLFSCVITTTYGGDEQFNNGPEPFRIGQADLWWNAQLPEQLGVFQSRLRLSEAFFDEIIGHSVPVDMRVLQALRESPMALDVYAWCAYRLYTLNRSRNQMALVPWEALQRQFGAGYPETTRGRCDFRKAFLRELARVLALLGSRARITPEPAGLRLAKSAPLIASRTHRPRGGHGTRPCHVQQVQLLARAARAANTRAAIGSIDTHHHAALRVEPGINLLISLPTSYRSPTRAFRAGDSNTGLECGNVRIRQLPRKRRGIDVLIA